MKGFPGTAALLAAIGCATLAMPAQATNGYFAHGQGAVAKGMAGAGLTMGEGPGALAQNPALGVGLGNAAGGDATVFMPNREAEFYGPGPVPAGVYQSDSPIFLVPSGGVNWMARDDTAVGLVLFGNGGMNTDYGPSPFAAIGGTSPAGVDLMQAFLALNVAHQLAPGITVGVAPVLAVQTFEAYGLEPFAAMSADPANVTNRGHDVSWGGGVKLGVLWNATEWLDIGASLQSRMWMSKFEDYRGLFADEGDFDIPPYVAVGVGLKPMQGLSVLLEWQRIFYEAVDAVGNSGSIPRPLGSSNGPGFGWNDMDVFRIGLQYDVSDAWTVRTGFSHATDFSNGREVLFNTLAPGTIKNHASAGATWRFAPDWAAHLAYTFAFQAELDGVGMMGQRETLRMHQHEISLGLAYRF